MALRGALINKVLFVSWWPGEGDDAKSPSFGAETWGLRLPAHCWKRSLQLGICWVDENGGTLPTANKYLFANLLFFISGEGDEATSPSFAIHCALIEASCASLEALIAV